MEQPEKIPASAEDFSAQSPTSSQTDDAPTHFDHLIGTGEGPEIGAPPAPAPVTLGRDEFHKLFMTGFKVGHGLTGLQSLAIPPEREGAAQECSHAIYDSIMDIPALHFMLEPQNKWIGRCIAIGAFTVPMAISVRSELQARRRPAAPLNFSAAQSATRRPDDGTPTAEQAAALGAM